MIAVRAEDILQGLATVGGFLGAAAVSPAGEILALAPGSRSDMPMLGAVAADAYLHAKGAFSHLEDGPPLAASFECAAVSFLVFSPPPELQADDPAAIPFHVVVALTHAGNVGLAKLRVSRFLAPLAEAFRPATRAR